MSSRCRFVHRPYRPGVSKPTKRRPIDMSRVYRVFCGGTSEIGELELVDLVMPATRGDKRSLRAFDAIRLFYVGAEEDLDRYLAWLTSGAFSLQDGTTPDLLVWEEDTIDAYRSWYDTYVLSNRPTEPPELLPIFPGQIASTIVMLRWPDPMGGKRAQNRKAVMY